MARTRVDMTWFLILCLIFFNNVFAKEKETRTVILDEGGVIGTEYWDGDFFEFFGVPYAEAPVGRDRYQAPLPVKPWNDTFTADMKNIACFQSFYTEIQEESDKYIMSGDYDCLVMNLYVPKLATEDNLVPVVVYVHSGAFAGGNGNMARFHYLARHDIVVISFNYRLGALGFACLGNKQIPGNAGMKDQVAALKWIKKNVKKFGGDPNKVTLAGYSVGASMAELISLSKTADGLFDQLILDSASALSPFAINRDPINTAKNLAYAMGYNGTGNLDVLTEFYLNVPMEELTAKSLNFFLPNSTFGFAPCIENVHKGIQPFLTESPIDILKKGRNIKVPILIGFSNMEGLSRSIVFGEWREKMTEDFSPFLPADLVFDKDKNRNAAIAKIKQRYFNGTEINHEKLQGYTDYFSDAMFKYSIMKSLRLQAAVSKRKIYLYEFNYVGKLNMQHIYMDKIKGASHRDQTAYILDFFGWTNTYKDLEMRDRMTTMWTDFVKYGDPTAYESAVVNYKWLPYTNENQNYLYITRKPTMKKNLFTDGYNFWDKFYEKYYWNPKAPVQPKVQSNKKKQSEAEQAKDVPEDQNNKENEEKSETSEGSETVNEVKNEEKKVKQKPSKGKKVVKKKKEDLKLNQEPVKEKEVVEEVKKENSNDKEFTKENQVQIEEIQIENKEVTEEETAKETKPINTNKKQNTKLKDDLIKGEKNINEKKEENSKDKESVNEIKIDKVTQNENIELKEGVSKGKKSAKKNKKESVKVSQETIKQNEELTEVNELPKTSKDTTQEPHAKENKKVNK